MIKVNCHQNTNGNEDKCGILEHIQNNPYVYEQFLDDVLTSSTIDNTDIRRIFDKTNKLPISPKNNTKNHFLLFKFNRCTINLFSCLVFFSEKSKCFNFSVDVSTDGINWTSANSQQHQQQQQQEQQEQQQQQQVHICEYLTHNQIQIIKISFLAESNFSLLYIEFYGNINKIKTSTFIEKIGCKKNDRVIEKDEIYDDDNSNFKINDFSMPQYLKVTYNNDLEFNGILKHFKQIHFHNLIKITSKNIIKNNGSFCRNETTMIFPSAFQIEGVLIEFQINSKKHSALNEISNGLEEITDFSIDLNTFNENYFFNDEEDDYIIYENMENSGEYDTHSGNSILSSNDIEFFIQKNTRIESKVTHTKQNILYFQLGIDNRVSDIFYFIFNSQNYHIKKLEIYGIFVICIPNYLYFNSKGGIDASSSTDNCNNGILSILNDTVQIITTPMLKTTEILLNGSIIKIVKYLIDISDKVNEWILEGKNKENGKWEKIDEQRKKLPKGIHSFYINEISKEKYFSSIRIKNISQEYNEIKNIEFFGDVFPRWEERTFSLENNFFVPISMNPLNGIFSIFKFQKLANLFPNFSVEIVAIFIKNSLKSDQKITGMYDDEIKFSIHKKNEFFFFFENPYIINQLDTDIDLGNIEIFGTVIIRQLNEPMIPTFLQQSNYLPLTFNVRNGIINSVQNFFESLNVYRVSMNTIEFDFETKPSLIVLFISKERNQPIFIKNNSIKFNKNGKYKKIIMKACFDEKREKWETIQAQLHLCPSTEKYIVFTVSNLTKFIRYIKIENIAFSSIEIFGEFRSFKPIILEKGNDAVVKPFFKDGLLSLLKKYNPNSVSINNDNKLSYKFENFLINVQNVYCEKLPVSLKLFYIDGSDKEIKIDSTFVTIKNDDSEKKWVSSVELSSSPAFIDFYGTLRPVISYPVVSFKESYEIPFLLNKNAGLINIMKRYTHDIYGNYSNNNSSYYNTYFDDESNDSNANKESRYSLEITKKLSDQIKSISYCFNCSEFKLKHCFIDSNSSFVLKGMPFEKPKNNDSDDHTSISENSVILISQGESKKNNSFFSFKDNQFYQTLRVVFRKDAKIKNIEFFGEIKSKGEVQIEKILPMTNFIFNFSFNASNGIINTLYKTFDSSFPLYSNSKIKNNETFYIFDFTEIDIYPKFVFAKGNHINFFSIYVKNLDNKKWSMVTKQNIEGYFTCEQYSTEILVVLPTSLNIDIASLDFFGDMKWRSKRMVKKQVLNVTLYLNPLNGFLNSTHTDSSIRQDMMNLSENEDLSIVSENDSDISDLNKNNVWPMNCIKDNSNPFKKTHKWVFNLSQNLIIKAYYIEIGENCTKNVSFSLDGYSTDGLWTVLDKRRNAFNKDEIFYISKAGSPYKKLRFVVYNCEEKNFVWFNKFELFGDITSPRRKKKTLYDNDMISPIPLSYFKPIEIVKGCCLYNGIFKSIDAFYNNFNEGVRVTTSNQLVNDLPIAKLKKFFTKDKANYISLDTDSCNFIMFEFNSAKFEITGISLKIPPFINSDTIKNIKIEGCNDLEAEKEWTYITGLKKFNSFQMYMKINSQNAKNFFSKIRLSSSSAIAFQSLELFGTYKRNTSDHGSIRKNNYEEKVAKNLSDNSVQSFSIMIEDDLFDGIIRNLSKIEKVIVFPRYAKGLDGKKFVKAASIVYEFVDLSATLGYMSISTSNQKWKLLGLPFSELNDENSSDAKEWVTILNIDNADDNDSEKEKVFVHKIQNDRKFEKFMIQPVGTPCLNISNIEFFGHICRTKMFRPDNLFDLISSRFIKISSSSYKYDAPSLFFFKEHVPIIRSVLLTGSNKPFIKWSFEGYSIIVSSLSINNNQTDFALYGSLDNEKWEKVNFYNQSYSHFVAVFEKDFEMGDVVFLGKAEKNNSLINNNLDNTNIYIKKGLIYSCVKFDAKFPLKGIINKFGDYLYNNSRNKNQYILLNSDDRYSFCFNDFYIKASYITILFKREEFVETKFSLVGYNNINEQYFLPILEIVDFKKCSNYTNNNYQIKEPSSNSVAVSFSVLSFFSFNNFIIDIEPRKSQNIEFIEFFGEIYTEEKVLNSVPIPKINSYHSSISKFELSVKPKNGILLANMLQNSDIVIMKPGQCFLEKRICFANQAEFRITAYEITIKSIHLQRTGQILVTGKSKHSKSCFIKMIDTQNIVFPDLSNLVFVFSTSSCLQYYSEITFTLYNVESFNLNELYGYLRPAHIIDS